MYVYYTYLHTTLLYMYMSIYNSCSVGKHLLKSCEELTRDVMA